MAINKYMQIALKAISNLDIDIKKNYRLIRQLERAVKKPRIKKFTYQAWDYTVKNGDYEIPMKMFSPSVNNAEGPDNIKYPVIVFLHGGGWTTGDIESYENVCLTLSRQTGHIIIAVGYRLAPECPFPAALTDCHKAVESVLRWNSVSNSPHKLTLMGDSAGGNLAAAVSLYMRDRGEKTADRQILIYPAAYNDHTENSPFPSVSENGKDYVLTSKMICDYMDLYCGETNRDNPYLAPLLAKDFTGQPDTLIITAQYDPLRDEGEQYGRKLEEAGNYVSVCRIEDALHGYFVLPTKFSAVKKTYEMINRFLREDYKKL